MRIFQYIVITILVFGGARALAYDAVTTHAKITNEIVSLHNLSSGEKISENEGKFIVDGSIDEDSPVNRVLNHFLDPTRNIGIDGARNAMVWAKDEDTDNDFSWQKGIRAYASGDKEKAFLVLGHILHLIEDMSVPDHTRNDPHVGDGPEGLFTGASPYEDFSRGGDAIKSLGNLAQDLFGSGFRPKYFSDISSAFGFLSKYSNNNFFSGDTINSSSYARPKIEKINDKYGLSSDSVSGVKSILVLAKDNKKGGYIFLLSDDLDTSVLSDYLTRLSKQAVIVGAGVVDLFLREGEAARVQYEKEKLAKRELNEKNAAKYLEQSQNSGLLAAVADGFKSSFISPAKTSASKLSRGFSSGTKVIASNTGNVGAIAAYQTKVAATAAVAFITETIDYARQFVKSTEVPQESESELSVLPVVESPIVSPVLPPIIAEEKKIEKKGEPMAALPVVVSNIQKPVAIGDITAVSLPIAPTPALSLARVAKQEPVYYIGFGQGGSSASRVVEPVSISLSPISSVSAPQADNSVISEATSSQSSTPATQQTQTPDPVVAVVPEVVTPPPPVADTTAPDAPVVTSPISGRSFSSGSLTFIGTAEISVIVSSSFSTATTSADQSGNWSIPLSLPDGQTDISFYATDAAGNRSSSTIITAYVDSNAPGAPDVRSPATGSTLTDKNVSFSGLSEAGGIISSDFSVATTSADVTGAWSLLLTLPEGQTNITFYSTDSLGNRSAGTQVSVFVDSEVPGSPVIIYPTTGVILANGNVNFSGTAEASSIISSDFSTATTSASTDGNWSLSLVVSDGQTNINFYSTDAAGNRSARTQVTFSVDTVAPDASISIPECSASISSAACLLMNGNLTANWSTTATDVAYFAIDNNGLYSTTTSTNISATVADGSSWQISVSSFDAAGNHSATSTASARVSVMPVVINEVAWSGPLFGGQEGEWIELFNRASVSVNLDNFVFYSATDQSPYIRLVGQIPARGYYLIERKRTGETDEPIQSVVKDVTADMWVDFGSGLSNSGENLVLSYASTTIDQITRCTNWCAGALVSNVSAERINPDLSGNNSSNWRGNIGVIKNGTYPSGTKINGTPKARNSVNYLINNGQAISGSVVVSRSNSPYIIPSSGGNFLIPQGSSLNVESGTVIKIVDGGRISVDGTLITSGIESSPVVFTSFEDDSYAGDINGDGVCGVDVTAVCPAKGNWYGIEFSNKSTGSNLAYGIFRYGGKDGSTAAIKKSSIYVNGSSVQVASSTVEYAGVYGIKMENSPASFVAGSTIRYNSGASLSDGIYVLGGAPTFSGNTIQSNDWGAQVYTSQAVFENNNFVSNTKQPLYINGSMGAGYYSGNNGSQNTMGDLITLYGTITTNGVTTILKPNSIPYMLDGVVNVAAGSTLQIEDGVSVKTTSNVSMSKLSVAGRLVAQSNQAGGITFSSIIPNATNMQWYGILFNSGATSALSGVLVRDARVALDYRSSNIDLSNVTLQNNNVAVSAAGVYSVIQAALVQFINNVTDKIPASLF
ncbi:MAG: hypothetical protein WC797_01375 [Candidatus Paceibacterota bacterium]|jgi:hypothetical protein